MKLAKAQIGLAVFLVMYLLFMNHNLGSDLGYDEARHASQGHFFYDYGTSLAQGKLVSVKQFMREYTQKHYTISWYALYDPPVHAISQAVMFMVMGASSFAARFTTMIWVILGSLLVFLLSKSVLKSEHWALLSTILFLLSPISFYFSRQSMLTMPIAVMVSGWFYFTFYSTHKRKWIFSSLCLAAAGLMKYQTMIYFAVFVLAYLAVLAFSLHQKKVNFMFKNLYEHKTIRVFAVQSLVFLLAFFPWYWTSLRSTDIAGKLLTAGTLEVKGGVVGTLGYYFSFLIQAVIETNGLALLGLGLLLFSPGRRFLKQHWPLVLYVIMTFITASLLISNKQFRYLIHVLPFLIILAVELIRQGWMFCSLRMPQTKPILLGAIGVLCLGLAVIDAGVASQFALESGTAQDDLYDWIDTQNLPRVVMVGNLDHETSRFDSSFYHSEDLVIFRLMTLNNHHDPQFMRQSISRTGLNGQEDLYQLIQFFDLTKDTHTQILILHKTPYFSEEGEQARQLLHTHEFALEEFSEYAVFYREAPVSQLADAVFPTLAQKTSSLEHFDAGTKALNKGDYETAHEEFMISYRRDPLHFSALSNAAESLHSQAQELLVNQKELEAISLLHQAVDTDPTHDKSRQGLINIYLELAQRSKESGNTDSEQKFKNQAAALLQTDPLILTGSPVSSGSDQEQRTN